MEWSLILEELPILTVVFFIALPWLASAVLMLWAGLKDYDESRD